MGFKLDQRYIEHPAIRGRVLKTFQCIVQGLVGILLLFRNKFNKINDTGI